MKKAVLLLMAILCLTSCNQKKQPTEYKEPVDVTLRKADGDPVGTHRDANGVLWSDNDISAPREGETTEQWRERMDSYGGGSSSNQYEEGYEDGYEEGYEAGKAESR